MANRLASETSPYLLQHKDDPVDWYPWGAEALRRAREEQKPILLSIGYSSCHWCHVMARESFSDPQVAEFLNRHFVSVKVDREERPDLDAIYMTAVQAMTGQGGWPLTAALTPDGEPFFGGTYFPPADRYGQPAFRRVLEALAAAWRDHRDEVAASAGELREHLAGLSRLRGQGRLDPDAPQEVLQALEREFDPIHGGFGGAPKFPPHGALRFLLARPEENGREMALVTLRKMALGGIFDQLAGGFARYSVDERWLVPHFEKMLPDNAQLLSRYAQAYRLTADPLFAQVLRLTADWLERELGAPGGGFYSALDADSEGEEGRFYVWDAAEFAEAAGEHAELAAAWFGVSAVGNFEGKSVLTAPDDPAGIAARFGAEGLEERLESARQALLAARERRVRPGLDDKVVTSWNGLAIAGLAEAGTALHRPDLIGRARRAAEFVRGALYEEGRLRRTWTRGVAAGTGLLEDYAYLALGLLALYRATFEPEWLIWSLDLAGVIRERFADPDGGGFFSTPDDGEELIIRPKSFVDAAVPAENAAAAELFVHLGRLTGSEEYQALAEGAILAVQRALAQQPTGLGYTACALEFALHPPREVAVIGDREGSDTRSLLRIVQQQPLPYAVAAQASGPNDPLVRILPFLQGRERVDGRAAAYVCEGGTCRLPVASPIDLARELAELAP